MKLKILDSYDLMINRTYKQICKSVKNYIDIDINKLNLRYNFEKNFQRYINNAPYQYIGSSDSIRYYITERPKMYSILMSTSLFESKHRNIKDKSVYEKTAKIYQSKAYLPRLIFGVKISDELLKNDEILQLYVYMTDNKMNNGYNIILPNVYNAGNVCHTNFLSVREHFTDVANRVFKSYDEICFYYIDAFFESVFNFDLYPDTYFRQLHIDDTEFFEKCLLNDTDYITMLDSLYMDFSNNKQLKPILYLENIYNIQYNATNDNISRSGFNIYSTYNNLCIFKLDDLNINNTDYKIINIDRETNSAKLLFFNYATNCFDITEVCASDLYKYIEDDSYIIDHEIKNCFPEYNDIVKLTFNFNSSIFGNTRFCYISRDYFVNNVNVVNVFDIQYLQIGKYYILLSDISEISYINKDDIKHLKNTITSTIKNTDIQIFDNYYNKQAFINLLDDVNNLILLIYGHISNYITTYNNVDDFYNNIDCIFANHINEINMIVINNIYMKLSFIKLYSVIYNTIKKYNNLFLYNIHTDKIFNITDIDYNTDCNNIKYNNVNSRYAAECYNEDKDIVIYNLSSDNSEPLHINDETIFINYFDDEHYGELYHLNNIIIHGDANILQFRSITNPSEFITKRAYYKNVIYYIDDFVKILIRELVCEQNSLAGKYIKLHDHNFKYKYKLYKGIYKIKYHFVHQPINDVPIYYFLLHNNIEIICTSDDFEIVENVNDDCLVDKVYINFTSSDYPVNNKYTHHNDIGRFISVVSSKVEEL